MDFKRQKAIYMQIADYVLENILSEELKQGEKIQSVRDMASTVQVNPNTIMRSYTYLQDQGIIFNQRGIGYFVSDDALSKVQALKRGSFIDQELPEIFKMMKLLDIDFDELKKIYENNNGHRVN